MKYAVIYSKKDLAGINIAECLKQFFLPQVTVIETPKESYDTESIDEKEEQLKNVEFIIFATRHQAKESRNTLSLHAPGNWRNADFGGKPGKICSTSSLALKFLFQKMQENLRMLEIVEKPAGGLSYELTLEVTHHGPLIEKPCLFIEIGTTEEQWQDKKAGQVIAKTISDFQNFDKWKAEENNKKIRTAIAIGGPHYCNNFNKIQLSKESNIAISHIVPQYCLPLNETMLKEAIEKTKENTDLVLIDWKGCGSSEERQKILNLIEKFGLEYKRTSDIDKE
jgi:D-aminoacyl-tRNA deacylase